jgi:hypothetical protein
MAAAGTTFGVFHWLEVMDLDLFFVFPFLCLVLHITFQLFVFVSGPEHRLMPACNRPVLESGHPDESFIFLRLGL